MVVITPAQGTSYRDVVEQFATQPDAAIGAMLAMPAGDVDRGVEEATRPGGDWTVEAVDRALLMHGDAAIVLAHDRATSLTTHLGYADALATAAAQRRGNEYFVHRWCKAFTAQVPATAIETHWRQHKWFETAAGIDRARELERDGAAVTLPVDITIYDPAPFRQAIPLLERGVADGFSVAAVHLGRIQMLRGNDTEARRLLVSAARDQTSRVNRYLANLLLGSLDERDGAPMGTETYYRAAHEALPGAQSGRLALSAFLERAGRGAEARQVMAEASAIPAYDPWWSYSRVTSRDRATVLSELHAEVSR